MPKAVTPASVRSHFVDRSPVVGSIYAAILAAARQLGPVSEEPKKTSIHLVRKTAFAGVAVRKEALILTVKSDTDIASPRISKHERASANRWHLEVRLGWPREVDAELVGWLARAYAMSGAQKAPAGSLRAARFEAVLLAGHKGCAVEVPFDPAVRWGIAPAPLWRGRRGHRVAATLNGLPFQDAIVPRSSRFWLLVAADLLATAGVAAGDRVAISIEPLREPTPPAGAVRTKGRSPRRAAKIRR